MLKGKLSKIKESILQYARCPCQILCLNTKYIRNLKFNKNQRLDEIFVRSKEFNEIKESFQIHLISNVYTKLFI